MQPTDSEPEQSQPADSTLPPGKPRPDETVPPPAELAPTAKLFEQDEQ